MVKEGVAAGKVGTSGMHDVTEGGILGAIWEMCHLGDVGAEVWEKAVPVDPVTLKIAEHYGINHLRLISSGCMMIMASDERKDAIMEAVGEAGVQITCIGRIKTADEGVYLMHENSMIEEILPPEADELYKVV